MITLDSFLLFYAMLCVTYSTRLIGFFALRNRTLSKRAQAVMEAAPGCVLISVIAPYFVSDKPHELIAIALTVLAASRFSMLVTVIIGVASSGILGYLMRRCCRISVYRTHCVAITYNLVHNPFITLKG